MMTAVPDRKLAWFEPFNLEAAIQSVADTEEDPDVLAGEKGWGCPVLGEADYEHGAL